MRLLLTTLISVSFLISCGEGISYFTSSEGQNNNINNVNNVNNINNVNNVNNTTSLDVDDDLDGYTENQGDCNDSNFDINPGVIEICDDNIDNNCNGAVDTQEPDQDGDGYGPCMGDCNDSNDEINPAMEEIPDDGIDNNCDGITDADIDGDGYTIEDGDCDDLNSSVHPGMAEDCFDGIDNDCNGFADFNEPDVDGDGAGPCDGDCAEGDASIGPNNPEIAGDLIDNNCDSLIDKDIDGDGWTVENGDCNDNDATINPSIMENCTDGIDNNCDGIIDTGCLGPCELAELTRSSVGCTYYAIDTDNFSSYDNLQYAVVVSNTDPNVVANVQVMTKSGGTWTTIASSAINPNSLFQFNLSDRHIDNTGLLVNGAYKIVSDIPVIAYQFQPVDGVSSFTSDASLLLPTSALDHFYYIVGWGPGAGNPQINIIATQNGTVVTMSPSLATLAGGVIPAIPAGSPFTFTQTLAEGDFIQVEANSETPLTGTYIESNFPIAVFTGNTCANIPTAAFGYCDHVEEQMIGLQSWGKTYVAARMPVRNSGTPEATIWHIFASEDNTQISFSANSAVTGLPASPQTLNAGQFLDLSVSGTIANPGDFLITADKPILVMEYLSSSTTTNASEAMAGDPAMTQMVPTEQFLENYTVLVPPNWIYDYVILIKPVGASIIMDGVAVPQASFISINDGLNQPEWEVARITAADGVHNFDGDAPFGILVVGYDSYDSYAYPGGLNMQILNPIN
jgi:IgGFc binding protein/Putative metal-binding motif